jgi:hypothetical protein
MRSLSITSELLIFGPTGAAMTPSYTRQGGRLYRYYCAVDAIKNGPCASTVRRDHDSFNLVGCNTRKSRRWCRPPRSSSPHRQGDAQRRRALFVVEADLPANMNPDPAATNAMSSRLALNHVQRMAECTQQLGQAYLPDAIGASICGVHLEISEEYKQQRAKGANLESLTLNLTIETITVSLTDCLWERFDHGC